MCFASKRHHGLLGMWCPFPPKLRPNLELYTVNWIVQVMCREDSQKYPRKLRFYQLIIRQKISTEQKGLIISSQPSLLSRCRDYWTLIWSWFGICKEYKIWRAKRLWQEFYSISRCTRLRILTYRTIIAGLTRTITTGYEVMCFRRLLSNIIKCVLLAWMISFHTSIAPS